MKKTGGWRLARRQRSDFPVIDNEISQREENVDTMQFGARDREKGTIY